MRRLTYFAVLIFSMVTVLISCEKEEPASLPVLSTTPVTNISATTAISGGMVTSNGGAAIIANGVCWSTTNNPSVADSKTIDSVGIAQFKSSIDGLSACTTYHVRAYATSSVGTAYGIDITFSTLGQVAESITLPATNITSNGVTFNATVNANYLSTEVTFEYGLTTSYGNEVTANQSPLLGNALTNVNSDITGFTAGTTYHYRVKAVNSLGTNYGSDVTFTYTSANTVSDFNGNIYNPITIGTQVWLKENLKVTSYSNGDGIETTSTEILDISTESIPKYHWSIEMPLMGMQSQLKTIMDAGLGDYTFVQLFELGFITENQKLAGETSTEKLGVSNGNTKTISEINIELTKIINAISESNGLLYTWYVVTDSRNVCPTGWHVATDDDWNTLGSSLGGLSIAGGKLKEEGLLHWLSPNTDATNISEFTALPAGSRQADSFGYNGNDSYFWSVGEFNADKGTNWHLSNINAELQQDSGNKYQGYSVRCVKD